MSRTIPFLAAVVGAAFLLPPRGAPVATAQEKILPQWEYRAVSLGSDEKEATKKLNALAAEGWELAGPLGGGLTAFKRPALTAGAAAARKDFLMLQGTWHTVSIAYGDTNLGEDKDDTITYEGDKFVQRRGGQVWQAGTFKIVDATSNPKQIDYVATEGDLKGTHWRSIYTLEGESHRLCSDDGNDSRPKEFSGRSGFLRVTKREKQ